MRTVGLDGIVVECKGCESKFQLLSAISRGEYTIDGQSILLTYYDCPKCGRRHYVQADDDRTKLELKNVERQMARLLLVRNKGKKPTKRQQTEFENARERLRLIRDELMHSCQGKTIVEDGSEVVLRFRST